MRREAHHVTEGLVAPLLLSFLSATDLGLELVLETPREDDVKTHQVCKKTYSHVSNRRQSLIEAAKAVFSIFPITL